MTNQEINQTAQRGPGRQSSSATGCLRALPPGLLLAAVLAVALLATPVSPSLAEWDEAIEAYARGDYVTALRELIPFAEQGDARAQTLVGIMYRGIPGVPRDEAQAFKWFRLASIQGDDTAQFNLGVLYANGWGTTQNHAQALSWYRKAAGQGNAEAQHRLGVSHYYGKGVPRDYKKAAQWFLAAAQQGLPDAQDTLGILYSNGEGVPQDHVEAVRWWRMAAEQDHATAQYALGLMYYHGQVVAKDYVLSFMWLEMAAAGGESRAAPIRDTLADTLPPEDLSRAQRLVREWKPRE